MASHSQGDFHALLGIHGCLIVLVTVFLSSECFAQRRGATRGAVVGGATGALIGGATHPHKPGAARSSAAPSVLAWGRSSADRWNVGAAVITGITAGAGRAFATANFIRSRTAIAGNIWLSFFRATNVC